jgi:peptide/nickel transport system permease protein
LPATLLLAAARRCWSGSSSPCPLGVISAVRQGKPVDYVATTFSQVGVSIPDFWFGIMLILLLSRSLGLLPPGGYTPITEDPVAGLRALIMPALTAGVVTGSILTRFVRSSVLEAMQADHVRLARAKGLPERYVLRHHILRNAWIPVVTISGLQFATLLGGIVVVEVVFSWPGIGRLRPRLRSSAGTTRCLQGAVLVIATGFLLVNFLVDLLYGKLDPRIRSMSGRDDDGGQVTGDRPDAAGGDLQRPGGEATPRWRQTLSVLVSNRLAAAGLIVLLVLVVVAAVRRRRGIAPFGVNQQNLADRFTSSERRTYWFGTDNLGRDVFSRVVVRRPGVAPGRPSSPSASRSWPGPIVGLLAGYRGGWLDSGAHADDGRASSAFPVILLAIAIVAVLQPSLFNVMIAIAVVFTPIFARVVRGSACSRSARRSTSSAVRSLGASDLRIVLRHILPNVAAPIIVQTSLSLAFAILTEAALSYLGVGIQPPRAAWGADLQSSQAFLASGAWWMAVFPGLAILVTVMAFNLLGDGLRDVLDPKQRSVIESRGVE